MVFSACLRIPPVEWTAFLPIWKLPYAGFGIWPKKVDAGGSPPGGAVGTLSSCLGENARGTHCRGQEIIAAIEIAFCLPKKVTEQAMGCRLCLLCIQSLLNSVDPGLRHCFDLSLDLRPHARERFPWSRAARMDEIKGKDRVILALEKELGVQAGQTQKLLLQKEALDEQLVQVKEAERHHSSPKRELPPGIGDMVELMGTQDQHMDERDVRRFQLKIAELNSVIRKLEDRNTLLADERNELVSSLREKDETEVQLKPLVEKNKRMNKKNEDLLQSIQRMEEKIKNLTRENVEMKEKLSAQASLKRHTSLNDLSLTRDEQEIEFLRLQVLEQQHVIDDLSLVHLAWLVWVPLVRVARDDMGVRNRRWGSG
ncbi:hypothetical protein P7K49_006090 [Saguinus oedipus]|uniref:Janus kinase and microtubule interacting protein 1 n=1 Tax=Saguinus oedipus TaxID=9490 RepID=A0ABQ9W314_SAGOE|nr:hypothetical protein P7K49_006090 [Saguinus oedipus]